MERYPSMGSYISFTSWLVNPSPGLRILSALDCVPNSLLRTLTSTLFRTFRIALRLSILVLGSLAQDDFKPNGLLTLLLPFLNGIQLWRKWKIRSCGEHAFFSLSSPCTKNYKPETWKVAAGIRPAAISKSAVTGFNVKPFGSLAICCWVQLGTSLVALEYKRELLLPNDEHRLVCE